MVVVQVKNKDMNPTQNIRLQESTLLHLQSQGDKSEKCLTKSHVGVSAPQYDKHRTVQMFKKQNKELIGCITVLLLVFEFFSWLSKNKVTKNKQVRQPVLQ